MGLFKEARKFTIRQRIKELENAIRYWPLSDRNVDRESQLLSLRIELENIDEEK